MRENAARKPAAEKKTVAGKADTGSSGETPPQPVPWSQRRRRGGWCFAGVFAFLLFDCSRTDITPTDDVPATCQDLVFRPCDSAAIPTEVVSACQDLWLRSVAFGERCSGPSEPLSSAEEQAFVATCAGIAAAPGVALTHLDIKDCADQMDTSACLGGSFPSCLGYRAELLFPEHDRKGTFTVGKMCFANVQCGSGYCDHNAFDTCGICTRPRMNGETCGGATDRCIGGECREGICEPGGKREGDECVNHGTQCQSALYCNGSECAAYGQPGESCGDTTYCAKGLRCQAGACVTLTANGGACSDDVMCVSGWCDAGTCTAKPTGLGEGEDCSIGSCRADLRCNDSKACEAPTPLLPEGAACSSSTSPDNNMSCRRGLYCDGQCSLGDDCLGTCQPPPQPGEHCTSYGSCAWGAHCVGFDPTDLTKGLCVKQGGDGEPCPCLEANACIDGVCVRYGACL